VAGMEINIWGCLWNPDEGPFLMRQRIPEVCVFRGCQIDGWYHSNGSGLLMRRRQNLTTQELLRVFSAAAAIDMGGDASPDTPAAILRRQSTRLDGLSEPLDVPQVEVLTLQELSALMERVSDGVAEADIWSVQTVVQPVDGLRILSVYSCDATGEEKSDIFARQYHKVYCTGMMSNTLPCPEEISTDGCITVPPSRRACVESKTLNAIRFASRFHNLDFEGLVLEFIFTAQGNAVLHGCWCSMLFPKDAHMRLRSRPVPNARTTSLPRTFPVPTVEHDMVDTAREVSARSAGKVPLSTDSLSLHSSSTIWGPHDTSLHSKTEGSSVEECCVMLEVWRGDQFLGEALLPCRRPGAEASEHTLSLSVGDPAWPTRPDRRKRLSVEQRADVEGSVLLSTEWILSSTARAPLMRLVLLRAQGLLPPPPDAGQAIHGARPGVRVLLWQRRWGSSEFSALWASREAQEESFLTAVPAVQQDDAATAVEWDEAIDLSLGTPRHDCHGAGSDSTRCPTSSGFGSNAMPAPRPALEPPQPHTRPPIELVTSLKSTREHVCGAGLSAHWGILEEDGSMRTHILAAQVSQRLSTECRGRIMRSSLLTRISSQLEQYHWLQLEWEEELAAAKGAMERASQEIDCREKETLLIRSDIGTVVKEQESRLAEVCREMCGNVDEQRLKEHRDKVLVAQSQQRIAEQKNMAKQLAEKSQGLQASLDKTVRKFDEVSTSYAALQKELARRQTCRRPSPSADPELANILSRSQSLVAEAEQEEQELAAIKVRLKRLHDEMTGEQAHSLKLEDFVRRIATAPSTNMRTGGGYDFDYTARREAAMLIQEMAQG